MLKKGILICKSGIGNSIVANRVPGVRAALCNNVKVARLSREHNDSNVLVLGSIFVKPPLAKKITAAWLKAEFQGGRHERRLNQIKTIERKVRGGLR
jgi:ribose 5-phosphate isomerase B